MSDSTEQLRLLLQAGLVIPAHPLALDASRKFDEMHQRALTRYYCDAGSGGLAVAVHATQFAIRDPRIGLFEPVLRLVMEEARAFEQRSRSALVPKELAPKLAMIGGVSGPTKQACREAGLLNDIGYDAALISLSGLSDVSDLELAEHCRAVSAILPVIGFYLQPAVGGRLLSYRFWREFASIDNVVAIKIAPFNRYQTLDVIRAVADSGRAEKIALYTGNDDNIVGDLLTDFRLGDKTLRFAGGLLGHWAVWTKRAVELLEKIKCSRTSGKPEALLDRAAEITDSNAALFDVQNGFRGCIAGVHEILRRQGLLAGRWCLDPQEDLSPGQLEEIDRVCRSYPHLTDDDFVAENLDRWLA
jgi:dihydrodipicolinate synthase/N-acetylneuraminate lyase